MWVLLLQLCYSKPILLKMHAENPTDRKDSANNKAHVGGSIAEKSFERF